MLRSWDQKMAPRSVTGASRLPGVDRVLGCAGRGRCHAVHCWDG
ncbi:hypothetical protein ABTE35_19410 [Acinetobacter baumannii]